MTYQSNTYEDDDMHAVIETIEALQAKNRSIMASAMAECRGNNEKIKAEKKTAKDDLGIPLKVLNPILKRRALERKIAAINESVDEDYSEVFEDAAGQFCMFAPVESGDLDEPGDEPEPPADDAHEAVHAAEQAEGADVLNGTKH